MQIQQKVSHLGFVKKKNEISINTISPGEEQMNKQAQYHLYVVDTKYDYYVVDISFKQLHFFVFTLLFPLVQNFRFQKPRVHRY